MVLNKIFYFKLYLFWLTWVSLRTFFISIALSIFSALMMYIYKGFAPLNSETFIALLDIVYLSFPIAFSLSFILMLLFVFRALFMQKVETKCFVLYDCQNEEVTQPNLSDVMGLWRKWLFLTVWLILLFLVLFIGLSKLLFDVFPPAHWFNAYSMYVLVSSFGGLVFVFSVKKCKKIGIKDA